MAGGADSCLSSDGTTHRSVLVANLQTVQTRRGARIAGGTNEMQRNVISERVLGLPREYAPDKDRPFAQVRHNKTSRCVPPITR